MDTDRLVEEYLEELRLLFICHGLTYTTGETHEHNEATDTTYENDTYTSVSVDSTYATYSISTNVSSIIPRSDIRSMLGTMVEMMDNDIITAAFEEGFDKSVDEDFVYGSYYGLDFLYDSRPYKVVQQVSTKSNERGNAKQTYIYPEYLNH